MKKIISALVLICSLSFTSWAKCGYYVIYNNLTTGVGSMIWNPGIAVSMNQNDSIRLRAGAPDCGAIWSTAQWVYNTTPLPMYSGLHDISLVPQMSGNLTVTVQTDWGNTTFNFTIIINQTTGINIIEQPILNLKLQPNPAKNKVVCSFYSILQTNANILIQDVSGKIIQDIEIVNSSGQVEEEISLENYTYGVYIVSLITDSYFTKKKLLVLN